MRFFNVTIIASVLLLVGGGCIPQASAPTDVAVPDMAVVDESSDVVLYTGRAVDATAAYVQTADNIELRASALLPVPDEGYFYEGWIVRREPLSVVSTGALYVPKNDDKDLIYENIYVMTEDQLDHPEYIITIEPDDGDPAPAEHVVEIMMEAVE